MLSRTFSIFLTLAATAACSGGNLKSAADYGAPPAPLVRHPYYNPYTPYGQANATWTPTVADRDGTVVKPYDPNVEYGRPLYEAAPWATGLIQSNGAAPPGTF